MTVYALSFQADWRCGRSGACCTSGWPIPIESALDARLRRALATGALDLGTTRAGAGAREPASPRSITPALLRRGVGLDAEHASLAGVDAHGGCVFFEPAAAGPAACTLQRQLGPDALPVACRLFPRVCLLEPRGVSITLSHYCPTVAGLLWRDDAPLTIVRDPPAFPDEGGCEGLDARDALPPLLRPDALLDWDSHARFEAHAVATLGRGDLAPEAALDRLATQAERLRAWRASHGPSGRWMDATLALEAPAAPGALRRLHALDAGRAGDLDLVRRVLACVPAAALALARGAADVPKGAALAHADRRYVEPVWADFARPAARYLAARAFASWCAHQGRGLRTRVLDLAAALALLRVQAARVAARAGRALDRALFVEAVRAGDLLLLHLASRERLASALSACEART